jgi:hypothetical protein
MNTLDASCHVHRQRALLPVGSFAPARVSHAVGFRPAVKYLSADS